MVVKGLPVDYKSFIAVTSQSEDIVQNFQKFKQALRNFVDTEKVCVNKPTGSTNENSVMKDQGIPQPQQNCVPQLWNRGKQIV